MSALPRDDGMAIHSNLTDLTKEVIEEYLEIAGRCVNDRKPDGGIYGYPATLLLFSVVDALSISLRFPKNSFRALNESCFELQPELTDCQIKNLKNFYRNLLAHRAAIAPGVILTPEVGGPAFGFSGEGELITIRVVPFYEMVRNAWQKFDKSLLNSAGDLKQSNFPRASANVPASTAVPFAASGVHMSSDKGNRRR